jgi:hypothetical protein
MAIDNLVVQLPDADGDRIEDVIDTDPLHFTEAFSDATAQPGGTTNGSIVTRGDQILSITEHPGSGVILRTDPRAARRRPGSRCVTVRRPTGFGPEATSSCRRVGAPRPRSSRGRSSWTWSPTTEERRRPLCSSRTR